MKFKLSLVLFTVLLLHGCAMMGTTEYELEPIMLPNGDVICCKAIVYNSKNYDNLNFEFVKNADGSVKAVLKEKGVNATDPATVGAENNAKLLDTINKLIPQVGGG